MTVGTARPKSITKQIDGEGYTTYTTTYDVPVTDPFEDIDAVTLASGIPGWGETLSFGATVNSNAFCIGKTGSPTLSDGTNLWRVVTCTFSNKPGTRARSGGNVITNPLNEPWKKGGSFAIGTRVTSIDKDGAPIMTTGRERKFFEVPDGYATVQTEGPSATFSFVQATQAVGRCNSATIWDLTARQLYLAQWQWQELFHGDTSYFYHRMEWWIKYAGWNEVWLNEGTQQYISGNPEGKKIVPIIAPNDTGGKNYRYLDANGVLLTDANVPSGIITNTTMVIPEFDFTVLTDSIGLPNPLPGNFV